jgi:hypothetical protein
LVLVRSEVVERSLCGLRGKVCANLRVLLFEYLEASAMANLVQQSGPRLHLIGQTLAADLFSRHS